MRKIATALLALPVVVFVYLAVGLRRSVGFRVAVVALAALVGVAGAALLQASARDDGTARGSSPAETTQASTPRLDPVRATTVETGDSPVSPITLHFGAPMDPRSVAALLFVEPPTPVDLTWAPDGTELVVRPREAWAPGTQTTVTIEAGALLASGRPTADPIWATFQTRPATRATLSAGTLLGKKVAPGTDILVQFDRPVDDRTVHMTSDPPVSGSLRREDGADGQVHYRFTPDDPLVPNTSYTFDLGPGARDADNGAVSLEAPLVVQTADRPGVVRFRPQTGTKDVALVQALSVRFTEAMDQASTAAGWLVTAGDAPVSGKVSFAEGDTVLVFQPASAFGYGQAVVMTVGPDAASKAGVALGSAVSGTFTTIANPATKAPTPPPGTGGGAVGAGAWAAVEAYYLTLMNCTRTGGWVQGDGSCAGGGSNATAPLWIDGGISSTVSRPYARYLSDNDLCSHFINGNPGNRLAAAGYTSYVWAENLGCQNGVDPYWSMLNTHLFFQSERSTGGGHYVNMMNPKYDRVGLAVWVTAGRVRLVIDFYHPL